MSTYLSDAARDQLHAAQTQLDRHTPSSADGTCTGCGVEGPCPQRRAALRALGRYGFLPRRRPGATRPDLIGAPASWAGWLTVATSDEQPNG